jgi:hypothetical protein
MAIFKKVLDDDESDYCRGDSLFKDLKGLEAYEKLIEVIRGNMNGEITGFSASQKKSLLSSVEKNYHSLLLKEFLQGENFVSKRLKKIHNDDFLRSLFTEVMTARNVFEVFLYSTPAEDFSEAFANVLFASRLLPLDEHKEFSSNIGDLYIRIGKIAKIHGQPCPKIEFFFPFLFDFTASPVSYATQISPQEHEAKFLETILTISPLILTSTITLLDNINSVTGFVHLMRGACASKLSWEEFVRAIVMKSFNNYKCCFPASEIIKELSEKVQAFSCKESNPEYLSVLLYAFDARKLKGPNFLTALKIFVAASKQKSSDSIGLKSLLSLILQNITGNMWTHDMLPYIRIIERNLQDAEVLIAFYDGLSKHSGYKEMYCPDIRKGLKSSNCKIWTEILHRFLASQNLGIPRSAFRGYYAPLKALLLTRHPMLEMKFYKTALYNLSEILVLTGIECRSDDWNLFVKSEPYVDSKICSKLAKVKFPPRDEESILQVLLLLMKKNGFENSQTVGGLMRIFESSKNSSTLALDLIEQLKNLSIFDYCEPEYWTFLMFIAEKVPTIEVHEGIFSLIAMKYVKNKFFSSYNLAKLIVFVSQRNLCSTQSYKKNHQFILERAKYESTGDDSPATYAIATVIAALDTNYRPGTKAPFLAGACLVQHHSIRPKDYDSKLNKHFLDTVDVVKKAREDDRHSLILIDFIDTFEDVPYFGELLNYAVFHAADKSKYHLGFVPRCMLSEANQCLKKNTEIPEKVRTYLLDVNHWYRLKDSMMLLLKQELRKMLTETQKLFALGNLDTALVSFASALFFLETGDEQVCSLTIFTQLAN